MKKFPLLAALLLAISFAAPLPAQAQTDPSPADSSGSKTAIFAGGCFWCMQYAFDRAPGVKKTVVGYTGGKKDKPDYESVSSGSTGHAESITVYYDPGATTYEKLLDVFWKNIDPTQVNGQFADEGTQYRTAIFYQNDEQKQAAEKSLAALAKSGKFDRPIATKIVPASAFFAAEDHHQSYYKKNPERFHAYEVGSGRVRFFGEKWGADSSQPKP